ncbi:MAG: tetratricopeptide repeat protein [Psychroserpens sp.]|uniref:SH3 domain-containing protein n=1 Tax=Psychroserpens sp. TaxID=2020870 RepID=UPI003C791229
MMKALIYTIVLTLSLFSFAQNSAMFDEANTLYKDGSYAKALDKYNLIVEAGAHSAELYFNMANAHYKLNHIAPSIYYYEKALLLKPNDKDIQNNLVFARNMTIDAIDKMPEVGFSKLTKTLTNRFSFDEWAKISIGLMLVFVLLFIAYYFSYSTSKKRFAFVTSLSSLVLALVAVAFAFHSYDLAKKDQPAIVFAQESMIKNEPNRRSEEAFKLHEGTKVQVLDTLDEWKQIKISDGKTGWVVSTDLKMLKTF